MDRHVVMSTVHARFAATDPELPNGFAEHAPMGAEAMLALGISPASVLAWAERHQPVDLTPDGPLARRRAQLTEELASGDWRDIVRRAATNLLPRLDAHLFHGLIRTAHAVRALEHHDDPNGRAELANGLAAWEGWVDGPAPDLVPSRSTDPTGDVLEFARRGAAAFVARGSIVTLHALTAPMAYLLLSPHLDRASDAVAAAAFAHTHRRHPAPPARPDERPPPSPVQLASLTGRWDAHPAKLVEAALRGAALSGDAAFRDAAASVLGD